MGWKILMKLTKSKLKEIIREELLNEIDIEHEVIDDLEARIFDQITEFRNTFQKSEWKKDRNVNSIINQMLKLSGKLGDAVGKLQ